MRKIQILICAVIASFSVMMAYSQEIKPLVRMPHVEEGIPAKGKMVTITLPEYEGTEVRCCLYLPTNYDSHKKMPLIVEFTGNKWPYGSGEVEDAHLGYSATLGRDFIWVVLPYVARNHKQNEVKWWGDVDATCDYAKKMIPYIIKKYSGDEKCVVLCGFSRGAIGASYIGLHDDEIAKFWTAFFTHDHFDGQKEWKGTSWGAPLSEYRREASQRLERAKGKQWYLSFNSTVEAYRQPIDDMGVDKYIDFIYAPINMKSNFSEIPNKYFPHSHNDCWPLFQSKESDNLRRWLNSLKNRNSITKYY